MRALRAAAIGVWVLATSCGGGGGSGPLPTGLAELYPIDGQFDFASLPVTPSVATLALVDQLGAGSPTGTMTTLRWVVLDEIGRAHV